MTDETNTYHLVMKPTSQGRALSIDGNKTSLIGDETNRPWDFVLLKIVKLQPVQKLKYWLILVREKHNNFYISWS